jgi:transposase
VSPRRRCTRRARQCADEVPCVAAPGAPAQQTSRHASARETPRVQQARARSPQRLPALALQRVTCVDDSGVTRALTRLSGRAPTGERVVGSGPQTDGPHVPVLGALDVHGLHAGMTVDGATDPDVVRTSVKPGLGPPLRPGDMVGMDHLRAHTAVGGQQALARRGARLRYLPPSAPDLSPIAPCWSQVQTALRTAKARTREALDSAITGALASITDAEAPGWFRHCGDALR